MLPLCKLQNRTNLCYCNAVCTALYWLGEVSTLALACYGTLEAGLRVMRANKPIVLPDCLALRPLFVHWRHLHQQHDAGEFLQHLLSVARPRACDCGAPLLLNLSGGTLQGDLVAIPVFTADTDLCTRLVPSNHRAMDVALYALPDHMQLVALEESLLLKALRDGVDDASALRPCFTLFTRNEIVYAAMQVLKADSLQHFLEYADMLARSNIMDVLVNVPEPDDEPGPYASRAEILAYHYLQEGRCALWTAVRSVARDLPFDEDPRSFTNGHTLRLGLYNKGGMPAYLGHKGVCLAQRLDVFCAYCSSSGALGKARDLIKDIAACTYASALNTGALFVPASLMNTAFMVFPRSFTAYA
ncbi:hypothetical protein AK812_SmicGene23637 [Symbiodinium microadriaticum]|uniref:Uncharacterized protein n=1 Tax=Symbiodinium microadriaticum TaxID=2951 RepID=A0A1Q9DGQ3_SYMMI|nr:hypothetical protein AK812_SmicGene23637 [Symbiodinium microadriaticum]